MKVHYDPVTALAADAPSTMMPWNGDRQVLIDRFVSPSFFLSIYLSVSFFLFFFSLSTYFLFSLSRPYSLILALSLSRLFSLSITLTIAAFFSRFDVRANLDYIPEYNPPKDQAKLDYKVRSYFIREKDQVKWHNDFRSNLIFCLLNVHCGLGIIYIV